MGPRCEEETWPTVAARCDALPPVWAVEWRVETGGCAGSNTSPGPVDLFAGTAERRDGKLSYVSACRHAE
ncbi:hypothetical protein NXS19_005745 [Fusarium pseudograminearum]|nr:hypothetical protein NXS19_005745 [Fusarium pseudograminearum]